MNLKVKISNHFTRTQEEKLRQILTKPSAAFAWDYADIKGVPPNICKHHIYIKDDATLIRQPQRRMNPALKDIVKAEWQKLIDVEFI